MTVKVHYDGRGRIVSVLKALMGDDLHPTGILPIPDCKECDLELTDEQASLSLLEVHTSYGLELAEGVARLVPLRQLRGASIRKELMALETEELREALREATGLEPSMWEEAKAEPKLFLQNRGVTFPEGVEVFFEERPLPDPPPIDFEELGISSWRCFKWCTTGLDDDGQRTMMRCEDICLPIFTSRLG